MVSSIGLNELESVPEVSKEEDKRPEMDRPEAHKSITLSVDKAE